MIRGWKPRRHDEAGADARRAGAVAFVAALALGAATTATLMWMTPPSQVQAGGETRHEEAQEND
jgi:hypothetical protein